jgi:solute carrier family 39 (zinc transporter), member 7
VSFATGGLLGDVFIHLLPEIFLPQSRFDSSASAPHVVFVESHRNTVLGATIFLGFATFFIMEKVFRILSDGGDIEEHGHSHSHSHHSHGESTALAATINSEVRKRTKSEKEADGPTRNSNSKAAADIPTREKVKLSAYLNLIADATHSQSLVVTSPFLMLS